MDATPSICFTCAQATDEGTELNRLEDGRVCPSCAERLIEDLPSLLPGGAPAEPEEVEEAAEAPGPHLVTDPEPGREPA